MSHCLLQRMLLILGTDELPVLSQVEDLTKGVVYEVNLFRQMHDISWEQFEEWLMKLFCKYKYNFGKHQECNV